MNTSHFINKSAIPSPYPWLCVWLNEKSLFSIFKNKMQPVVFQLRRIQQMTQLSESDLFQLQLQLMSAERRAIQSNSFDNYQSPRIVINLYRSHLFCWCWTIVQCSVFCGILTIFCRLISELHRDIMADSLRGILSLRQIRLRDG